MQCKKRYLAEIVPLLFGVAGLTVMMPHASAQQKAGDDTLPMTKNVISGSTLEQNSPQDGYEALKNVAGVTNANSKGTISDNINIRGIPLSFSTSYRLNGGLPIANILAIPMENKERLEALKGANALMYGLASPAGIVNLITKRATDKDINNVSVSGTSFGGYGTAVDLGRKFGDEKQFGLRVNLAAAHLETGVDGGSGKSHFAGIAADWKASDRLSFKFDVEKFGRSVIEQSTLLQLKPVNGVIQVPRLPDPTKLLSGSWAEYKPHAENMMLRGDYLVSDAWKLIGEIGQAESARDRFISRISNYNLATGQGTENITVVKDQKYTNKYAKAELLGKFATGPLRHNLTMGVMSNERDFNGPSTTALTAPQNIYDPVTVPAPRQTPAPSYLPQVSKDTGLYAYDSALYGKWVFLAGMRSTRYKADNAVAGGRHSVTETTTSSPALGLIYNLTPDTSIYASYMKGLEETGVAPAGTVNQFQILPPASATQSELGLRTTAINGINASVAYFNITRANTVIDAASNTFLIDGTTKFQGVEATVGIDFSPELSLNSGAQYMHAVQNSVIDKTINGLEPENTPKLSGNMGLTWSPKSLGGVKLNAGAIFTGRRAINPQNQAYIPGVTVFSAGAGYSTKIAGRRTTFQMNVDNLFNKAYWASAGGGAYGIGMVRSVKANMKIEF
jgi:iron complex outermembrane receptor protein